MIFRPIRFIGALFALVIVSGAAHATSLHTITIDGINDFSADEALVSSSAHATWYFTWDNSSFYFGMDNPDIVPGAPDDKTIFFYIDATPQSDPASGPGIGFDIYSNSLPFSADYAIEHRTNDTFTLAQQSNASESFYVPAPGVLTAYATSNDYAEFQLSRSAMGNPTDLYVLGYLVDFAACGGDGFYNSNTPSANTDGCGNPFSGATHWLHYTLEDGVSPGNESLFLDSTVPIPAAVWLFGSALAGFGFLRRRQTA